MAGPGFKSGLQTLTPSVLREVTLSPPSLSVGRAARGEDWGRRARAPPPPGRTLTSATITLPGAGGLTAVASTFTVPRVTAPQSASGWASPHPPRWVQLEAETRGSTARPRRLHSLFPGAAPGPLAGTPCPVPAPVPCPVTPDNGEPNDLLAPGRLIPAAGEITRDAPCSSPSSPPGPRDVVQAPPQPHPPWAGEGH